ncbi:Conserved_hypothetical protein [Hexamita inflata]|uniref:Uncharacterized protein n=1 Tax=Hexamita inflata TaxID=28002 RepID=A0AA86UHG3_9EUKA|nr:Conserved hypothetical protein [Hexamita inflata]
MQKVQNFDPPSTYDPKQYTTFLEQQIQKVTEQVNVNKINSESIQQVQQQISQHEDRLLNQTKLMQLMQQVIESNQQKFNDKMVAVQNELQLQLDKQVSNPVFQLTGIQGMNDISTKVDDINAQFRVLDNRQQVVEIKVADQIKQSNKQTSQFFDLIQQQQAQQQNQIALQKQSISDLQTKLDASFSQQRIEQMSQQIRQEMQLDIINVVKIQLEAQQSNQYAQKAIELENKLNQKLKIIEDSLQIQIEDKVKNQSVAILEMLAVKTEKMEVLEQQLKVMKQENQVLKNQLEEAQKLNREENKELKTATALNAQKQLQLEKQTFETQKNVIKVEETVNNIFSQVEQTVQKVAEQEEKLRQSVDEVKSFYNEQLKSIVASQSCQSLEQSPVIENKLSILKNSSKNMSTSKNQSYEQSPIKPAYSYDRSKSENSKIHIAESMSVPDYKQQFFRDPELDKLPPKPRKSEIDEIPHTLFENQPAILQNLNRDEVEKIQNKYIEDSKLPESKLPKQSQTSEDILSYQKYLSSESLKYNPEPSIITVKNPSIQQKFNQRMSQRFSTSSSMSSSAFNNKLRELGANDLQIDSVVGKLGDQVDELKTKYLEGQTADNYKEILSRGEVSKKVKKVKKEVGKQYEARNNRK